MVASLICWNKPRQCSKIKSLSRTGAALWNTAHHCVSRCCYVIIARIDRCVVFVSPVFPGPNFQIDCPSPFYLPLMLTATWKVQHKLACCFKTRYVIVFIGSSAITPHHFVANNSLQYIFQFLLSFRLKPSVEKLKCLEGCTGPTTRQRNLTVTDWWHDRATWGVLASAASYWGSIFVVPGWY